MKLIFFILMALTIGCQPPLEHQPKVNPFSESPIFSNQSSARPQVEGTIDFYKASDEPEKLTSDLLELGQKNYNIHCAVCHGLGGDGDGIVTERGFTKLSKFEVLPVNTIETLISNGEGSMPSFKGHLGPRQRWAIAHYVRVLVLREQVASKLLSKDDLESLNREAK